MQLRKQEKRIQVPRMAASKRFSRYKREVKREEMEAKIKSNKPLQKVLKSWERFQKISALRNFADIDVWGAYLIASAILENIRFSSKTVEEFNICAKVEEDSFVSTLGIFLGALINHSTSKRHDILILDWDDVSCMCFGNRKDVTVSGDVGEFAGTFMESGKLVIKGNAEEGLGADMKGGIIIVEGDIYLHSKSGYGIGDRMSGGEIHINGDIVADKDLSEIITFEGIIHGKVYHKGKLIVDK